MLREKALTLACVKHHAGKPCKGGSLVGSDEAKRWLGLGNTEVDLKRLKLAKNPALNAYFTSLVNLGCFVTENDTPASEDESEAAQFTFDHVELSAMGVELAMRYDSVVGSLPVVHALAAGNRRCSVDMLADLGKHGGLCELTEPDAADRTLLRDIFFSRVKLKGDSHPVRRKSLLLVLELCRLFAPGEWRLTEQTFADAVYYGELTTEDDNLKLQLPPALTDNATRWRMFYFQHYMSVALEGMFSWLVTNLATHGLAGASLEQIVRGLGDLSVQKTLSGLLDCDLNKPFGEMTPSEFFSRWGVPPGDLGLALGTAFDHAIHSLHPVAEDTLEGHVREGEFVQSSSGLALPMILLATTLARYSRWTETNYDEWLAGVADPRYGYDPYLDLVPPLLTAGLNRRFDRWWVQPWQELTEFVLSRYVVRQHQAMSYKKSSSGHRCLLQTDGKKVFTTGHYDEIGIGNPRLLSAVQVLEDLGLTEDTDNGVTHLTEEGKQFLRDELTKEAGQ